jgi:lysophospholipase L1-like esterase
MQSRVRAGPVVYVAPLYENIGVIGTSVSVSNPLSGSTTNVFSLSIQIDSVNDFSWGGKPDPVATQYLFVMGTAGQASSIVFWRATNSEQCRLWCTFRDSNNNATTILSDRDLYQQTHQCTVAVTTAGVFIFMDGIQVATSAISTPFTHPETFIVGGTVAGNTLTGVPLSDAYMCGPTATPNTGVPSTAIGNYATPAQWTNAALSEYAKVGIGVTPIPGAVKVLCIGDSLTRRGWRTYPQKLAALLGTGYISTNNGQDATTIGQMRTRYQATYKGQGFGALVLLGGVIDLIGGSSTATITAALEGFYEEVRDDGLILVACTLTPYSTSGYWSAGQQTKLLEVNDWIRAYGVAETVPVADLYAALGKVGSTTQLADLYDLDGLHLTANGTQVIAETVEAVWP